MATKKSAMKIKRGYKRNLPILQDGQLGYCKDSKELYIGNDGKNDLINPKVEGGTGSGDMTGTVTAEYLKLVAPNGREFKISVTNSGELNVTRFIPEEVEGPYSGLKINQIYGGGVIGDEGTAVTHGFIELYNDSNKAINLNGLSVQYAKAGNDWEVCELSGMLPAYHSYLIRANRHSEDDSLKVYYVIDECDKDWGITMFNKGIKVCLMQGTEPLEVVDPYKEKVEGYIDMIACGDSSMDAAETLPVLGQSKQKAVRRKEGFIDTQDNEMDCEIIDYRSCDIEKYRPRYTGDGAWNEFGEVTDEKITDCLKINQVYAGGSDGAISHHFVEIYNTHKTLPILLDGISLYGAHYKDLNWQHIPLTGTIPPQCSYLIRGAVGGGAYKYEISNYDLECTLKLEKGMKVFLIESTDPEYLKDIANPFNINGAWKKVDGYIDGFGCHGNSGNNPASPGKDMIDAYESEPPGGGDPGTIVTGLGGNSKQTTMRRINFQDTNVNSEDFEPLRFANWGVDLTLNNKVPRWLAYGPWDENDIFSNGSIEDRPYSITNNFGSDPTSTRIFRWLSKKGVKATLKYGIGNTNTIVDATTVDKADYAVHTVKLSGLEEGTTYMYQVAAGEVISSSANFTTSTSDKDEFEFIHVTDSQGSTDDDFKVWGRDLKIALNNSDAEFISHTGDHVEDKGDTKLRWDLYFKHAQQSFMSYPVIANPGNNDTYTSADWEFYKERYTYDNQCPACDTAYYFEYGNTFFLSLDYNRLIQEQKTWADEVLEATDKKWKIVLIHAAPYTSFKESTFTMAETFEKHNVDLVLCGHKHMYMRSYPMKDDQRVNPGEGPVYVMGNSMGVKQGTLDAQQPWMEVRIAPMVSCYNNIKVTDESIELVANKIVDSSVEEIDNLTITK